MAMDLDPGTRIIELGMTLAEAREQIATLPPEVSAALDSWLAAHGAAEAAMAELKRAARRAGIDDLEIKYLADLARRDADG